MKGNSGRPVPIIADGVEYSSVGQAATALGVSNSAVLYRMSSPNFPTFHRKGEVKPTESPSGRGSKAVIADGVEYSSISQAATALKLSNTVVRQRADDPNNQTYQWKEPQSAASPTVQKVAESLRRQPKTFEERQIAKPLIEPKPWPFDGGTRRAQVLNPNFDPPRLIRKMGWARCMTCRRYHFSEDVARVRICCHCGGNGGDKLHNG